MRGEPKTDLMGSQQMEEEWRSWTERKDAGARGQAGGTHMAVSKVLGKEGGT